MSDQTPSAPNYMNRLMSILQDVTAEEIASIRQAAAICADAINQDHMIYLFGTGHSHMLAEEGHYRAGGLACVCPILASGLMLHEGAAASTGLERNTGVAATILSRYALASGDVMILFSNSGINTVPVEAASYAKNAGLQLIVVMSCAYAAASRKSDSDTVATHADIVIDNHIPPGDAVVLVPEGPTTGPASTVVGAFILNAVLTETVGLLKQAPLYISANMPGAAEHNQKLITRFRPRNPHL